MNSGGESLSRLSGPSGLFRQEAARQIGLLCSSGLEKRVACRVKRVEKKESRKPQAARQPLSSNEGSEGRKRRASGFGNPASGFGIRKKKKSHCEPSRARCGNLRSREIRRFVPPEKQLGSIEENPPLSTFLGRMKGDLVNRYSEVLFRCYCELYGRL